MVQLLKRALTTSFGLFLFAFGYYLSIRANIGLAPWTAFDMGISGVVGLSLGTITVITSFVIVGIDLLLKEKIGLGTILNAILIGNFVDLLNYLDLFPMLENFWLGVVVLLIGQVFVALGSFFYIKPGLGCGPRDSLMIAIGKRAPKMPIGVARGIIEGSALLIGWLTGAKVGIGTVIAVFGVSFILDVTFRILKFNVKAVQHENIIVSFKNALTSHGD